MDLQLSGKRALVTGGSRGIGRAIAQALLAEGARVAIAARDREQTEASARGLMAGGGEVHAFTVDTRDASSVDALVSAAVETLGGLDILINAAARPGTVPVVPGIAGVDEVAMLEDLNTKVLGYVRMAKAVAPHLVRNGWGRIINISGLSARLTGSIPGSMRNVAVSALTKELADELGPKGINVTVVHPGPTRTERTAAFIAAKAEAEGIGAAEAEKLLFGGSLIGRIVDAEEVAAVVAFLASPKSVAINGDAIAVGGGLPRSIHY